MILRLRNLGLALVPVVLLGCAGVNKHPQTREEFVSDMKAGGVFRNSEQVVVKRPLKAVVADVKDYAAQCLDVSVSRRLKREAASSTTYRPIVASGASGVTTLTVQELYNGRPSTGAPSGGIFTFVAEMRASGSNATQVDVYYVSGRGKMLSWMKPWLEGQKDRCPAFN